MIMMMITVTILVFIIPVFSSFHRETKLNGYLDPFWPQKLLRARCLPFAGLWSSISWLGELQLWCLTGQQITALLKALREVTNCTFVGVSPSVKKEFHCDCPQLSKLRFILSRFWLLCHICKWWKWDCELQRIFLLRGGRYLSLWVCLPFFSGRNINRNPTFTAAVIPVIKTCWQLKVKFIVTLGPRVRCHIKNWLCMQSWPWKQTQETRWDQRAAQWGSHHYSGTVQLGNVCLCVYVLCERICTVDSTENIKPHCVSILSKIEANKKADKIWPSVSHIRTSQPRIYSQIKEKKILKKITMNTTFKIFMVFRPIIICCSLAMNLSC